MHLGTLVMTHKLFAESIDTVNASHALFIVWLLITVWKRRFMTGKLINKVRSANK